MDGEGAEHILRYYRAERAAKVKFSSRLKMQGDNEQRDRGGLTNKWTTTAAAAASHG